MRARVTRFTAALQALLLMGTLVLPALAGATEIFTDLWVYNDGDTVTVTGIDFGANEVVDFVTTDPDGAVVDTGSAQSDGIGGVVYAFVLHATTSGIYDVVGTGQSSGFSASTQFDPPPPAPTNLRFVDARAAAGDVTLTWTGGTGGSSTECFRVYRSATTIAAWSALTTPSSIACAGTVGGRTPFAVVAAPTASYVDAATAGSPFYYRVSGHRAGNNQGESAPTNEVSLASLNTSPASNNFGSQTTGTSSASQTFTVTNNSNAAITFQSVTKAGTHTGDFAVTGEPAAGASIAVGASFTFSVTFTPSANGARAATLQINASSVGQTGGAFNTRLAPVSGTGIAAPANTPPSVSVTGVTHGSNYPKSTVPSAGCSVADAEDGNSSFAATLSPIAGPDAAFGVGSQTASCSYTDGGGLSASASATYTITDGSAPTISYVVTPGAPNGTNGWYITDVSLVWTVTEGDSPSTLVKTGCVDQSITSDQAATTYSCSASSDGGNAGPVEVTIKRDATNPTVTITPDRVPDSNGWYTSSVTFDTAATDSTSGVLDANCTADQTYSGPDAIGLTLNGSCTDNAGNVGNGSSAVFKFDGNGPTVTITTPFDAADGGTGWFNIASSGIDGVVVDVATSDAIGVTSLSCTDNSVDVGALDPAGDSFVIFDGSHSIECTATDDAANVGTDSDAFDVDQTDPYNVAGAPNRAADHNGWYNAPVDVVFTGDDDTSGIDTCTTVAGYDTDGAAVSVPGSCTDVAGNTSADVSSSAFDYDNTDPTVTLSVTGGTLGNNGWYTTDVTIDTSGIDLTSGVLDANCTADQFQTTDTTGTAFNGMCTDNAGNVGSAAALIVKLDKTDPSVAITSPTTGTVTVLGTIAVSGTASDTPSGIDAVTVNGGPPAVLGVGTFASFVNLSCGANTISAVATDLAGRTTTSGSITVMRVCAGTLQYHAPLDQSTGSTPTINKGKFGRVIPVKVTGTFNVGGSPIAMTESAIASYGLTLRIGVNGATCTSGAASDTVEAYADAGSSNANTNLFRWSTSQWIYNLDTGNSPSVAMVVNKCYRLDVRLVDAGGASVLLSSGPTGSNPYAIFQPTK